MTLFTLITINWLKQRPGLASQWGFESPPRCLPMDGTVSLTNYRHHLPWHEPHKNCSNSRILFVNLSFLIGLMVSSAGVPLSPQGDWMSRCPRVLFFLFLFSSFFAWVSIKVLWTKYLHETINNTLVWDFFLACLSMLMHWRHQFWIIWMLLLCSYKY